METTDMLAIFWGIISLIFLTLVILHLKWSIHEFSPLEFKGQVGKIMGLPLGIKEAVEDISDFIGRFNKHNKKMNIAQFVGYLVAFFAAFFSFVISLVTNI